MAKQNRLHVKTPKYRRGYSRHRRSPGAPQRYGTPALPDINRQRVPLREFYGVIADCILNLSGYSRTLKVCLGRNAAVRYAW